MGLSCWGGNSRHPNIILISIDTLRADHLGIYGYQIPTSPSLDAFREDAILFDEAIAQAPSTLPSHASIFTSLIPQHHRASHTHEISLAAEAVTLAEILRDAGYRTLAVTGGGQLDPVFGIDQGFDHYETHSDWKFRDTVGRGLSLLSSLSEDHEGEPFFLFLHTYEVHHPYTPDPGRLEIFDGDYSGPLPDTIDIELLKEINNHQRPIDGSDLRHIVATYDAEILSMDDAFGDLLDSLRGRDLYSDTMIVFTSDHGEEFGEHGFVGWHSHTLFDELLRVPLLIKLPGLRDAGATVTAPVQGIDVAPSILAGAGLEAPTAFEGVSVLSYVASRQGSERPAVIWRETNPAEHAIKWGIRTHDWKFHEGRLFDLSRDPDEQHDVAGEQQGMVAQLTRAAGKILTGRTPLPARPIRIEDTTRDELRALGYIH